MLKTLWRLTRDSLATHSRERVVCFHTLGRRCSEPNVVPSVDHSASAERLLNIPIPNGKKCTGRGWFRQWFGLLETSPHHHIMSSNSCVWFASGACPVPWPVACVTDNHSPSRMYPTLLPTQDWGRRAKQHFRMRFRSTLQRSASASKLESKAHSEMRLPSPNEEFGRPNKPNQTARLVFSTHCARACKVEIQTMQDGLTKHTREMTAMCCSRVWGANIFARWAYKNTRSVTRLMRCSPTDGRNRRASINDTDSSSL